MISDLFRVISFDPNPDQTICAEKRPERLKNAIYTKASRFPQNGVILRVVHFVGFVFQIRNFLLYFGEKLNIRTDCGSEKESNN